MADIGAVSSQYFNLVNQVGKLAVHSLYPNEFEYYMLSLELVDSQDNTIDYFAFPVMPESITKNETSRVNIKKTLNAVTVINSKSFVPEDIMIKGNFGRDFKVMINPVNPSIFKALRYSTKNNVYDLTDADPSIQLINRPVLSPYVKTGYGCMKILQSIVNKAKGEDASGRPFKLYLYNPTLGENYLVVPPPNALSLTQNNNNNNMIWAYSLSLTIIAPLNSLKPKLLRNSAIDISQKLTTDTLRKSRNFIGRTMSNLL